MSKLLHNMKLENIQIKLGPLLIILLAVIARILPHPDNFAPVTAMALFSGVYLSKRSAFILPIIAMFLSDIFIGFYGQTMLFVYGSFLLVGAIGVWIKHRKRSTVIIGASLVSSLLFYLITNFGVWLDPVSNYSKTFSGLMDSYLMGLPFFRGTLIGDLFYSGVFFGGYELAHLLSKKVLSQKLLRLVF